jgi:DNA-binding response OmpR family regulator
LVTIACEIDAARESMEEAWPDVLVIEHRVLEQEPAPWLSALSGGDALPLIVLTAVARLPADSESVSLRGEEALGRLEALAVRLQGVFAATGQPTIRVGKLTIDPARKEVIFAARRTPLPPHQFRLLLYLALNTPRVVSQTELLREIWGFTEPEAADRDLVKTHIRQIRRRLGWTDETDNYLQSVRGFGYVLSPPPDGGETP